MAETNPKSLEFNVGEWVAISTTPLVVGKIFQILPFKKLLINPAVNLNTSAWTGPLIWNQADVSPFNDVGAIPNRP